MPRRKWEFNQNGIYSKMEGSTKELISKRRRILERFLITGDTTEARAYCKKYKVPAPRDEEGFRRHLHYAAERVRMK